MWVCYQADDEVAVLRTPSGGGLELPQLCILCDCAITHQTAFCAIVQFLIYISHHTALNSSSVGTISRGDKVFKVCVKCSMCTKRWLGCILDRILQWQENALHCLHLIKWTNILFSMSSHSTKCVFYMYIQNLHCTHNATY